MLLELLCVLLTLGGSCWAGWFFSQCYFGSLQKGRLEQNGARRLFSLVFGACCNTIVLVLFELLDILTFEFRLAALKAHIALLVLFMLCAIPCYHTYAMFRVHLKPRHALAATAAAQVVFTYLLLHLLPAWPGVPEPVHTGLFSLRVAILRTGVLGVCVIAVLAGFGTVDFPYSVLRAFIVPVNPYEVNVLQSQLQQLRSEVVKETLQIADKEQRLALLQEAERAAVASQAKEERGWLAGMVSSLLTTTAEVENVNMLQQSIEGLRVMEMTLAADVSELVAELDRERASATLLGRAFNVLGYALAAYCVFKMFSCLKSVLFGEDFTTDPVSRVLGIALRLFSRGSLHLNVKAASQYVTLLFVGFVTFNSLRAFLKHMRRLATVFEALAGGVSLPGARGGSVSATDHMMLGLGALLCAYTVSTVMLLRAQLPVAHRALVTQALGFDAAAVNSEFDAVHRWFNGMQLVSLLGSLCLCYWQFKNKKANVLDLPSVSLPV